MSSKAQRWVELFQNNPDIYAIQQQDGGYLPADWVYEKPPGKSHRTLTPVPITDDVLYKHFTGQQTIGMYAIGPENTCRWMCWDWDFADEHLLIDINTWLTGLGLHPLREGRRENRAGHLWVFFDAPVPTSIVHQFGQVSRALFNRKIEFYPKQNALSGNHIEAPGNLVRLPLGKHQKVKNSEVWGWFDGCEPVVTSQVNWLLKQPLSSSSLFLTAVEQYPPMHTQNKRNKRNQQPHPKSNLLNLLPEEWPIIAQPNGEYRTKCPVCAEQGHDKSSSNLYIGDQGQVMFCHYGQGGEHTFKMILDAFKRLRIGVQVL